jgi:hypothetical protein
MKKHLDQVVAQDYSGYVPYRGKEAELEVKNLK